MLVAAIAFIKVNTTNVKTADNETGEWLKMK